MFNSTRGILMFAHNNTEIDYFRIAVVNSMLVQKNLGINNITVVTDSESLKYAEETLGRDLIDRAISNIILVEKDIKFKNTNIRTYKDTSHSAKNLSFYNASRSDAYDLSPYDETLMIDADYLILSDTLNHCWGSAEDIMMNWNWQDIMHERECEELDRLNETGITMYWATVVYFRKTEYVETFFNCVKHVKENSKFYKDLYKWSGSIYRNDYSFSIAAHMMGGFIDKNIPQLPTTLYKTFDHDDIYSAEDEQTLIMYLEKPRSPGDFILTRWSGVDLHVMNKWAINRTGDKLMEILSE